MIGIDPGLGGTGLAIAKERNFVYGSTFGSPHKGNIDYKSKIVSDWVADTVLQYDKVGDNLAVVEYPEFYTGAVGISCASTGGLVKLAFLVGAIVNRLIMYGYRIVLVTPNEWKGNLPKKISTIRIQKLIHFPVDNHLADAIGLLMHYNDNGIIKNAKEYPDTVYTYTKNCFNTRKKHQKTTQ